MVGGKSARLAGTVQDLGRILTSVPTGVPAMKLHFYQAPWHTFWIEGECPAWPAIVENMDHFYDLWDRFFRSYNEKQ